MEADRAVEGHQGRLDWRAQTAGILLGAAGGIGVNLLSNFGFRVFAVVAGGGAVVAVTNWIRKLPVRAPLARSSIPALLCVAAAITVLALFLRGAWAGWATLISVGLLAAAVLLAATWDAAVRLLAAATSVGLACAVVGAGVAILRNDWRDILLGAMVMWFGAILFYTGIEVLRGKSTLRGTEIVGVGIVGLGGAAIAFLHGANVLLGGVIIVNGATLLTPGLEDNHSVRGFFGSSLTPREMFGPASIVVALIGLGAGIQALRHGDVINGAAAIWAGLAGACAGAAVPHGGDTPSGAAAIVLGTASVAGGLATMSGELDIRRSLGLVLGGAVVGVGLAAVGGGLTLLHASGLLRRIGKSWKHLTQDPASARAAGQSSNGPTKPAGDVACASEEVAEP